METLTLTVEMRAPDGQKNAGALRRSGRLPGVFYGPKTLGIPVVLEQKEFLTKLGKVEGSQLIRLQSPASELDGQTVLLKEVQVHPATRDVLHVDLYAVDLTRRLRVRVPVHFVGKAAGVTAGGVLQPLHREVLVECLPAAIPGAIEVDVSALGVHETIHVQDLTLPGGVDVVADTNYAVVTVLPPTVEAAPAAAEGAPEVAVPAAEGTTPTEEGAAPPGKG